MDTSLGALLTLARDTVVDPRAGARRIVVIDLTLPERWMALGLMAVVWSILTHLIFEMGPIEFKAAYAEMMTSPLRTAVFQGVFLAVGALAVHRFGRARGGSGSLQDAVILIAWLLFIWVLILMAELVASVILPPLGALIGLGGMLLFFWLLTNFVAELHGFRSLGMTFVGIVLGLIALLFTLSLLLAPFLPMPPGT